MALKFDKAGEQELLLLFLNQLDKESDRGCALVAAGYLEDQLKKVLQARMVKHTGPAEEIFEGHEALATFSAKIKVAYLLGIVSHEVYSDLNRIRDIRNAFAHSGSHEPSWHPPSPIDWTLPGQSFLNRFLPRRRCRALANTLRECSPPRAAIVASPPRRA